MIVKKKFITSVIIALLIGLGGGYGIGFTIYQSQISELHSDLSTLTTDYNNLNATYNQLQSEVSNLQSQLSTLRTNYDGLNATYNELQASYTEVLSELQRLEALIEALAISPSNFTGTLHVFEWGGYEDPDLWNVGESAFKKMYPNVDVKFSFFMDESEALAKLKLGFRPDIVHPGGGSIQRWYDAGVIEPLDTSLIPNWQNMSERFITYAEVEETPVAGKVYFAPADWGYSTVIYRPDILEQLGVPPDEWDTYDLLFNPKLKDKVMVMDSAVEVTPMAALAAGVPADHIWNMNDTEMAMTRAKLLYQKLNLIRGYWTVPTQVVSAMASGEVAAANIWGESYVTLKDMGVNVTFSWPKEGTLSWVCGFSIVEGLKERNPDLYKAAHAFINAWMDPQAGANLIDLYAYGSTNKYAHTLAERTDTIALLKFDDPAVLEDMIRWKYTPNEADWVAMWDEVKADP